MSYDLSIQKDTGAAISRPEAESVIAAIDGVRDESPGVFVYQRGRQLLHFYTGDAATIDSIDASVPAVSSAATRKQALRMCFQIADRFGCKVFDPQVGEYLDGSAEAELLNDDDESRVRGKITFGERYWQQLQNHDAVPTVATLVVAAAIAGYLVVQGSITESSLAGMFLAAAVVVHLARAFAATLWQTVRPTLSK